MNRRSFFQNLAAGIAAAFAPTIFIPKLIKPVWKPALCLPSSNITYWAIYNGVAANGVGDWIIQEHLQFAAPMPIWMPTPAFVQEEVAKCNQVIIHNGPGFNVVATNKPQELLKVLEAGRIEPLCMDSSGWHVTVETMNL